MVRQAALDCHEEARKNQIFQFFHDGATLLNELKHQAFGMQFEDAKIRCNNSMSLSFRKPLTHKADEVAKVVEEGCLECFNEEFNDMLSSPVQDLAPSAVATELNVKK